MSKYLIEFAALDLTADMDKKRLTERMINWGEANVIVPEGSNVLREVLVWLNSCLSTCTECFRLDVDHDADFVGGANRKFRGLTFLTLSWNDQPPIEMVVRYIPDSSMYFKEAPNLHGLLRLLTGVPDMAEISVSKAEPRLTLAIEAKSGRRGIFDYDGKDFGVGTEQTMQQLLVHLESLGYRAFSVIGCRDGVAQLEIPTVLENPFNSNSDTSMLILSLVDKESVS